MIILIFALAGLLIGALVAKRRGGTGADIAQYAFVYALVFAIVGLFGTIGYLGTAKRK